MLEYKHFRMLEEENLQDLANFCNRSLRGEPFEDVFAGDFYALPNKLPHGPKANAPSQFHHGLENPLPHHKRSHHPPVVRALTHPPHTNGAMGGGHLQQIC